MNTPRKNRLTKASSPYLQQHAHNPVDWYEWGDEALQKAKEEDKPILISIGYSACHWCHVMERESYSDEEVAHYMNTHFVAIKVDREERPDLDQIYIEASQLLNGHAGWPLNAFALPDGRPFWVGTYFPKKNWLTVLQQINAVYTDERLVVEEQATALTEGIRKEQLLSVSVSTQKDKQTYINLFDTWKTKIDFEKGGMQGAPKFPMPSDWEFLLQYHYLTGNKEALKAVNSTLTAMAFGGIYDQLGGGFARYATDENWHVPHFEKMLYDNAQLVSLYAHAYQLTKKPLYQSVVEETLAFVQRELTGTKGEFYTALNADSEGEEGKYYSWKSTEIDEILEEEKAALFKAYYNVIPSGNWEDEKNILFKGRKDNEFAMVVGLPGNMVKIQLHAAKQKLLAVRNKRIHPSTDDKVLLSWNALMLKAYVEAYQSLQQDEYLEAALKNATFIQENMQAKTGKLYRNYKDGKASIAAFLDDYAFLAEAYIMLYQVTFSKQWLNRAKNLVAYACLHFYDKESGLFFYTANDAEHLIARKFTLVDNEIPSSNAVMAHNLYKLGMYFDDKEYRALYQKMWRKMSPLVAYNSMHFSKWALLLGEENYPSYQVAVMGKEAFEKRAALQKNYLPTTLFMGGEVEDLPLLEDKLIPDKTYVYVCSDKTCKQPVQTTEEVLAQLK